MNLVKWKFLQAVSILLLIFEYVKDFYRFICYGKGSPLAPLQSRLFYDIILFVHTIEKGLSLANPRPFFGKKNFRLIGSMIDSYSSGGIDFPIRMAKTACKEYLNFHLAHDFKDPFLDEVRLLIRKIDEKFGMLLPFESGKRNVADIYPAVKSSRLSYTEFLQSRFSCRAYSPGLVSMDLIREVARAAQSAPSQCNRQAPKLHLYQNQEHIRALLSIQGGASGFSHEVANLFIVSSEITAWSASSARNQDYIDGSLFSMTLLFALHAKGLAACPLNIAFRNSKEKKIRRVASIPDSQRLIMMIAFGFHNLQVHHCANSSRMDLDHILSVH